MTPEKLGKYEIRSLLGKGAMGVVYEGWDPFISRRVAIKTVRLPDPTDAEAQDELARFKREAQAAGRLTHPNVVGVFDYGETGDLAFIVMEFVEGQTLKGLIGEQDRMALPAVERIMSDVLEGLAYCHDRGVVHRDIKPANIMITPEGQAKIADFGIARIESSSMTQAGTVLGTPAYMSPEQFMGVIVDARTDIYSTGVLLFQLLTGDRPFEGSMTTIMHKVLNTVPPKPSDLSVTAPRNLDDIVARAMARRPEDRFPSAGAFLKALEAAIAAPAASPTMPPPAAPEDGTVIISNTRPRPTVAAPPAVQPAAVPAGAAKSRSKLPLFIGVAVVVLAAAGIGGYVATRPSTDDQPTAPAVKPPANTTTAGGGPPQRVDTPVQPPKPGLPPIQNITPVAPPDIAANRPPPSATVAVNPPTDVGSVPTQTVRQPPPPPLQTSPSQPVQQAQPPVIAAVPTLPTQTPTAQNTPPVLRPVDPTPVKPPPEIVQPTTPPQQVVAMLSPTMLGPALGAALAATPCSFTVGSLWPQGTASVEGLAAAPAIVAMRQAADSAAPGLSVEWKLTEVDAQFCAALDIVHGLAPKFGSPRSVALKLDTPKTVLVTDDYILPQVFMPDYPAYLTVDYLVHDGTVVHLYPNKSDPAANDARRQFAARALAKMGEKRGAFPGWQVYEPYGRDLIIAVVSSTPLLPIRQVDPTTLNEKSGPYLADLKAAVEAAAKRGARLAADALVLDTAAQP